MTRPETPQGLTTHQLLLDTAADVARRLRAFDEYGSEERARRALRRRSPGFDDAEYTRALASAVELFDAAHFLAVSHAAEFQALREPTHADWAAHARELARRYPVFAHSTCVWVLDWTIYYFARR